MQAGCRESVASTERQHASDRWRSAEGLCATAVYKTDAGRSTHWRQGTRPRGSSSRQIGEGLNAKSRGLDAEQIEGAWLYADVSFQ